MPLGILVVNRAEFVRPALARVSEQQQLARVSRYRGFDGNIWPQEESLSVQLKDGLASVEEQEVVRRYALTLDRRDECDLVLLRYGEALSMAAPLGWRCIGYDLGYFESECAHFSVVLNEVLFGAMTRLRRFADRLNQHSLFATRDEAREAGALHDELFAAGADVEHGKMEPIEISVQP